MKWEYRYMILVDADKKKTANNRASAWDKAPGVEETFQDARASPDGTEPATHYIANTKATEEMKKTLLAKLSPPWVTVLNMDNFDSPEEALASEGLKQIRKEPET
jgi:hypothetical protein